MMNKIISIDEFVKGIFKEVRKVCRGDKKLEQKLLKKLAGDFSRGKFGMNSRYKFGVGTEGFAFTENELKPDWADEYKKWLPRKDEDD
jgi:hypothetical protein